MNINIGNIGRIDRVLYNGNNFINNANNNNNNVNINNHRRKFNGKEIPNRLPLNVIRNRLKNLNMGIECICCWDYYNGKLKVFWKRIIRACNQSLILKCIYKITKCLQKDGRWRYDIYCSTGSVNRILKYIQKFSRRWRWYARKHIHGKFRKRSRNTNTVNNLLNNNMNQNLLPLEDKQNTDRLGLATYNCNGFRGKKYDIHHLLLREKIDILGLQETLITDTDWNINIPGYYSFEVSGSRQASERGVAILLNKQFSGYVVGETSPWCINVRISGNGLKHPIIKIYRSYILMIQCIF